MTETTYGHPLRFGYFLVPNAADPLIDTALRVEELGLDYLGIQDHPYQRRYVDTWTLLPYLAARTTKLRLFTDVANLPLRHPSIMAKASASLAILSGNRFDLGLGAGAFWDAIEAYGGERRSPGESLDALIEAIQVIRKIWSGERNLRFHGDHYHLAGAQSGPLTVQPIGIWLGTYGPRALGITARIADGWVPSYRGDMNAIAQMTDRLNQAAADADRDPAAIRRVLNVSGTITDGDSTGSLEGPADQWIEELTRFVDEFGFDTFIFGNDDLTQVERFATEVSTLR